MTDRLQTVSVKLPGEFLRRMPANKSEFIRQAVAEKLAGSPQPQWKPATSTGRKLWALRKKYVAQGGELLDAAGVDAELRQRRGGLA